jgi:thiol-disulfide isomerase/thioredoxin
LKRALALGALLALSFSASAADAPPPATIDAAGLERELAAMRGRVVIVNLWASWCSPCLKEIPMLMRLAADLEERGVQLVGVAMDEPGEGSDAARSLREKHFPGFRTWLRGETPMDALIEPLDPAWNEILPTTYLIGRDGRVARRVQGVLSYEEFRALLEPLAR